MVGSDYGSIMQAPGGDECDAAQATFSIQAPGINR